MCGSGPVWAAVSVREKADDWEQTQKEEMATEETVVVEFTAFDNHWIWEKGK